MTRLVLQLDGLQRSNTHWIIIPRNGLLLLLPCCEISSSTTAAYSITGKARQDLAMWASIDALNPDNVCDFMSPKMNYFYSTKTFIFGLHFGFTTKTPLQWMIKEKTKHAMRTHKVCWATTSNSSCSSGRLLSAGLLLMKAPNTYQLPKLPQISQKCVTQ